MPGRLSSIEVGIAECNLTRCDPIDRRPIAGRRTLETANEQVLRFGCWRLERQRLQRANLGDETIDGPEQACEEPGLCVVTAVVAFKVSSPVVEYKRALLH